MYVNRVQGWRAKANPSKHTRHSRSRCAFETRTIFAQIPPPNISKSARTIDIRRGHRRPVYRIRKGVSLDANERSKHTQNKQNWAHHRRRTGRTSDRHSGAILSPFVCEDMKHRFGGYVYVCARYGRRSTHVMSDARFSRD